LSCENEEQLKAATNYRHLIAKLIDESSVDDFHIQIQASGMKITLSLMFSEFLEQLHFKLTGNEMPENLK
jgi:hypothetical protein